MNKTLHYPLTLYYEAACPLCDAEMRNLMLRNTAGLLRFVDVSDPGFDSCPPGTTREDLMNLMHGLTADGQVLRVIEVFRLAYSAVGIPQVAVITRLPLIAPLSEALYARLARNRHRVPRRLVHWIFETGMRHAAERAAAQPRCQAGTCTPDSHITKE